MQGDMDFHAIGELRVDSLKTNVDIIPPTLTVSKIIGILMSSGTYEVFVEASSGKIAMVTTRDILSVRDIAARKTASLLTYIPKLTPSSRVGQAARLMSQHRIRALPIVEADEVVGQITSFSIVNALMATVSDFRVTNIMTPHPIAVNDDDSVTKAKKIMIRRKIDHLPILRSKKLSGIITASRIVFDMLPAERVERGLGAEKQRRFDYPVANLMDAPPVTCEVDEMVGGVISEMIRRNATYCIATFWGEVQGIITYRDVIKLVAEDVKLSEVPIYMIGLPEDPFESQAASDKFHRTVEMLKKFFPEIVEARSIIKGGKLNRERRRYEVQVSVKTPYRTFSYSEEGYELPSIYDTISDRMRLLAQRHKKARTGSVRRKV